MGTFKLFVSDQGAVRRKYMTYEFVMAGEGALYAFTGVKIVQDDCGVDLWKDTTTLFVKIRSRNGTTSGPAPSWQFYGHGVIRITATAFLYQLVSLRVDAPDARQRL